jgi:hypothetical protein
VVGATKFAGGEEFFAQIQVVVAESEEFTAEGVVEHGGGVSQAMARAEQG